MHSLDGAYAKFYMYSLCMNHVNGALFFCYFLVYTVFICSNLDKPQ